MHSPPQELGIKTIQKKRWWMVSGEWQKQHFVSPFQCRLTRLSLVKITPFFRYPKNIFIFEGTLICHISCDTLTPLLINVAYMELTEKFPDECNAHRKTSLSSCKFTSCKEVTIMCQFLIFIPTKFRRNGCPRFFRFLFFWSPSDFPSVRTSLRMR
jgi:hypothetical protein